MSATVNLVNKAVKKFGKKRENILPVLQTVVREEKYLSEQAMIEIARALDISSAEVYGTASFYTFLDLKPRGKNVIRVCKTITCYMKGKDDIIKAIEDRLKLKIGETTSDGKFSFLTTNCMGWCHKGPAMLINDKVFTELTPKKAIAAIEECF
jgi:NADH:ubiquinone oxidoreductase subunit E